MGQRRPEKCFLRGRGGLWGGWIEDSGRRDGLSLDGDGEEGGQDEHANFTEYGLDHLLQVNKAV
jgi:hypothetical protein